jgi:hypothetical protein
MKEIEEGEVTDAIAEVLRADDSLKQEGGVDPRDDPAEDTLESKASLVPFITAGEASMETVAEPATDSLASVPNTSRTFFGRMKKATAATKASFGGRIKKFKKGKPSSKSSSVENDIVMEKASETNESVHQEDSIERRDILETKDSMQQEVAADIRDDTPSESATLPAQKEEQAVLEVPSASEDSLKEKEDIVEDKNEIAVAEANEEAPANELDAPSAVEAKESRDDQPSIEAVQMDGGVALGFFSTKGSIMKEADDLLAQVSTVFTFLLVS